MEMEVMLPSPPIDFNFDSPCTSPYMSAPSSPPRFGTPFFSAPTSPTHISSTIFTSLSSIPFNWEHKPGLPKSSHPHENDQNGQNDQNGVEFAFDFSGQLDNHYLPADELFVGGKIKPLKPPPCSNYESSPKSPRSPKKTFKEAFSPRSTKRRDLDPFEEAFKKTSIQESQMCNTVPSSSRHHKTRSLSPFRVSDLLFDQETEQQKTENTNKASTSSSSSPSSSSSWYRKWKIKDLLLFRSASEGRPSSKALLSKYAVIKKNSTYSNKNIDHQEDDEVKSVSFRSVDSSVGSSSSSVASLSRRRSGLVSAHELHYTINRAVSEEMKRKTFLPYKQGLLGCLGFQHASNEISRGVGLGSMSHG